MYLFIEYVFIAWPSIEVISEKVFLKVLRMKNWTVWKNLLVVLLILWVFFLVGVVVIARHGYICRGLVVLSQYLVCGVCLFAESLSQIK